MIFAGANDHVAVISASGANALEAGVKPGEVEEGGVSQHLDRAPEHLDGPRDVRVCVALAQLIGPEDRLLIAGARLQRRDPAAQHRGHRQPTHRVGRARHGRGDHRCNHRQAGHHVAYVRSHGHRDRHKAADRTRQRQQPVVPTLPTTKNREHKDRGRRQQLDEGEKLAKGLKIVEQVERERAGALGVDVPVKHQQPVEVPRPQHVPRAGHGEPPRDRRVKPTQSGRGRGAMCPRKQRRAYSYATASDEEVAGMTVEAVAEDVVPVPSRPKRARDERGRDQRSGERAPRQLARPRRAHDRDDDADRKGRGEKEQPRPLHQHTEASEHTKKQPRTRTIQALRMKQPQGADAHQRGLRQIQKIVTGIAHNIRRNRRKEHPQPRGRAPPEQARQRPRHDQRAHQHRMHRERQASGGRHGPEQHRGQAIQNRRIAAAHEDQRFKPRGWPQGEQAMHINRVQRVAAGIGLRRHRGVRGDVLQVKGVAHPRHEHRDHVRMIEFRPATGLRIPSRIEVAHRSMT